MLLKHVLYFVRCYFYAFFSFLPPLPRLLNLSKSSLTQGDSQYIAGIHPEMDPEHAQGLFSVLTGEESLVEKWAVS